MTSLKRAVPERQTNLPISKLVKFLLYKAKDCEEMKALSDGHISQTT